MARTQPKVYRSDVLVALDESRLRHALWVSRLQRWIAHEVSRREVASSRQVRDEARRVIERSRVLQRRSRWLLRTGRPLPSIVVGK